MYVQVPDSKVPKFRYLEVLDNLKKVSFVGVPMLSAQAMAQLDGLLVCMYVFFVLQKDHAS